MCKFNSRLFVFLIVVSLLATDISAKPATTRSLLDLLVHGNDYDLRYDQRQRGNENVRIKLDGFFFSMPAEPTSLLLMTDELVNVLGEELLLARHNEEQGQAGDYKAFKSPNNVPELPMKQSEEIQVAEVEKSETDGLLQKDAPEERSHFNRLQGSRTKVYVMNLLDYIRRNRGA